MAQEIDCIIGERSLITGRYESIDALHYFGKQIEVSEILNKDASFHPFFGMMREVYKFMGNELAYMEDWMREIEKNIFAGREKDMVFAISATGRNLLNFRRIIDPHGRVLETLARVAKEKFGSEFLKEMEELMEEWRRLLRITNNQIDLMIELRETNNSLLNIKQNEIIKTLTIFAFMMVPLTLVTQIFSMNTINNPLIGLPYDFWIITSVMIGTAIAIFGFFKYKKWI